MVGETYYLSSLDSTRFRPVRRCHLQRVLTFDSGKVAIEARLSPAVIAQDLNRAVDIDTVILSPRHEDVTIDPVSEFPCFVFITVSQAARGVLQSPIRSEDLEIIGWGELYRTYDDAERHSFG